MRRLSSVVKLYPSLHVVFDRQKMLFSDGLDRKRGGDLSRWMNGFNCRVEFFQSHRL